MTPKAHLKGSPNFVTGQTLTALQSGRAHLNGASGLEFLYKNDVGSYIADPGLLQSKSDYLGEFSAPITLLARLK